MDVETILKVLTADAATALEVHFVEQFLRGVITDLRSERYAECREWAEEVEEHLIDQWGQIEGL